MSVSIRTDGFCGLSTHIKWQNWLKSAHPSMYADLMDHLSTSRGCGENRAKMESILKRIVKVKSNQLALVAFLKEHFPYTVEDKQPSITASPEVNEIFPNYNSKIMTYPSRVILDSPNIEMEAQVFCARQSYCDYLIIGGKAYIEYLSADNLYLKEEIPAKNWLLANYRKRKEINQK